ncbi:hypothetical protein [Bacteriovorax sp. Seq25_V]|uniref:hypothetical protein n=1 Tax=Bacteriovorax sp. Seq25_V TaxID=1201288 RepID=UPI000389F8F3|nr:hypothetical protein [Bacteriovorax sp. Seq25_V]EQC45510.1 hypothetical protein M900_1852 [Bacteriovorax sp. Seq25_V]
MKELCSGLSGAKLSFKNTDKEIVVKKIEGDFTKLKQQYLWFDKFKDIEKFPRVSQWVESSSYGQYEMPFYSEHINFSDYIQSKPFEESKNVLENIISFLEDRLHPKTISSSFCIVEYIDVKLKNKVLEAQKILDAEKKIFGYLKSDEVRVNDVLYKNIVPILDFFKTKTFEEKLSQRPFCEIHGDLTAENIIVNDNGDFILLDCNPLSGFDNIVVEYSKLSQSLHSGYENFDKVETVEFGDDFINFNVPTSDKTKSINSFFEEYLKERLTIEKWELYFHEAIHLARSLPYAAKNNKRRFHVLYGRMLQLFNQVMNEY